MKHTLTFKIIGSEAATASVGTLSDVILPHTKSCFIDNCCCGKSCKTKKLQSYIDSFVISLTLDLYAKPHNVPLEKEKVGIFQLKSEVLDLKSGI